MNFGPNPGSWQSAIAGVGVYDSGTSDHAALPHEEATDNDKGEDTKAAFPSKDLQEIASHRLTEI